MPRVTLKTGFLGPDGREEELSEYFCDAPGCPNIAAYPVTCVRELGLSVVVCAEHAGVSLPSEPANDRPGSPSS